MSRQLRIRPGPALDRLLDVRRARFLRPYLARTSTISHAAAEVGVSVARMSYQTARLVEAGLVEQVNLIARAGRPIAEYRSTADEFLVALSEIGDGDLEAFLLASEEPLRRALIRSIALDFGDADIPVNRVALRIRRTSTADVDISTSTIDGNDVTARRNTTNEWHLLDLNVSEARSLQRDLQQVLDRYAAKRSSRPTTYLIRVAVAPIPTP